MSGSAEGATHDGIAREGGRARALNLEGGGMNCMTGVKLARMRLLPARLRDISANALLSVALLSPSLNAVDHVEFTIFGRIRFSVPGDWPVIASKSDRNRTIFAFQVPNPADENTPDSTNLTIQSFYLRDPDSKSTFEKKSLKQDPSAQERKLAESWDCSSFQGKQGSTTYEIWDCHRVVTDVGVYVRVAWPGLPKNPADYDRKMQATLGEVLASVAPSPK